MDESPTKRAVLELKKVEGNDECADCGRKGELMPVHTQACTGPALGCVSDRCCGLGRWHLHVCNFVNVEIDHFSEKLVFSPCYQWPVLASTWK